MSEEKETNEISQQIKEIEIRSDEVQEIMGFIPHWIVRWGITVIFIVIVVILIGSWFFKYPDIITSSVVMTTKNPPANLIARTTGKIETLLVQDKQKVRKGDCLLVIESATDYMHVLDLKTKLDALSHFMIRFENIPSIQFNKEYSLGQLQSSYASFVSAYEDYLHYKQLDLYGKKIAASKEQVNRQKANQEQLKRQLQLMEEDLKLCKQNSERTEALFKDGIISKNELENAKSMYIQKQSALEGIKSSLANSSIQINLSENATMELDLNGRSELKRMQSTLTQAYENLVSQITQWEQVYLLKAPVSGVITFTKYWSVNQNVAAGDKVVTIIPEQGGEIVGKVVLPILGSGKVKVGQRVNIKLTNYPYMDFGMLTGKITAKSLIASDNFYTLEVQLTRGMVTSYEKTLEFSQEMQGTAEIVTEEARLIDRFFKPIKNILDKM